VLGVIGLGEMKKGWQSDSAVSTSAFIRDYLMENGEAYIFEIYKALKNRKREVMGDVKLPSYQSFWRYIWVLENLGLIRKTRKEPTRFGKAYYEIVSERKDSPVWRNPQGEYLQRL